MAALRALPRRLAGLSPPSPFRADEAACYPPRPMTDTSIPQPPPIWWRFAVSITCTVTLMLAVVGVADVLAATLQG
ncbi:hypothetical protein [Acidisoma sp. S159]|uniref:hypothetical protein n=1 Tax=Acidisoma sp. S159 TaxID=1747225 RepID=UPI00131B10DF|nr:hypothetical protein [Acidisoma sp. S159]